MKKRHDHGALIEALTVRPPGLQWAARHVKHLGGLTLGEALGLPVAIPLKQLSACEAFPTLGALLMVTVRILDDCAHCYLLTPQAIVMVKIHGEGCRGSSLSATLNDIELMIVCYRHLDQVADAVIEAQYCL
jgi:hypothetical protein